MKENVDIIINEFLGTAMAIAAASNPELMTLEKAKKACRKELNLNFIGIGANKNPKYKPCVKRQINKIANEDSNNYFKKCVGKGKDKNKCKRISLNIKQMHLSALKYVK